MFVIFTIIFLITFSLSDVDECKTMEPCTMGTCINTNGGYRCQCPMGFGGGEEGRCDGKMNVWRDWKYVERNERDRGEKEGKGSKWPGEMHNEHLYKFTVRF